MIAARMVLRRLLASVCVSLPVFVAALLFYLVSFGSNIQTGVSGALRKPELWTYDARMRLRRAPKPSGQVIIVDIDEKTTGALEHWPLSRALYADALERLSADGARVVAFDVALTTPVDAGVLAVRAARDAYKRDVPSDARSGHFLDDLDKLETQSDGDTRFADVLRKTQIGVLAYSVFGENNIAERRRLKDPGLFGYASVVSRDNGLVRGTRDPACLADFAEAAAYAGGHIDVFFDADGILRSAPLGILSPAAVYPPLSLAAASIYLHARHRTNLWADAYGVTVRVGDVVVRPDWRGEFLIDYIGPAHRFPYVSLTDVVHGKFVPGTFRGKAAFVGSSHPLVHDFVRTPLQNYGFPGVEVHANVFDAIITGRTISNGERETLIDMALLAALAFLLPRYVRNCSCARLAAVCLGTLALIVLTNFAAFTYGHMWLNLTTPTAVILFYFGLYGVLRVVRLERQDRVLAPDTLQPTVTSSAAS